MTDKTDEEWEARAAMNSHLFVLDYPRNATIAAQQRVTTDDDYESHRSGACHRDTIRRRELGLGQTERF
jgi:hypothetical protein